MSDQPTASAAHPPARHARIVGWARALFVLAIVAGAMLLRERANRPDVLPTWPLRAGDVFPLSPGDANIAKWAQDPSSTGFVVQLLDAHGKPLPTATFCALEPDYMADAQQPGGSLTLVAQQSAGGWSVRWSGGNTVPPFLKGNAHFEANCGKSSLVLMSSDQLHALLDILNGVSMVTPSPVIQSH